MNFIILKRFSLGIVILLTALTVSAEDSDFSYLPNFHGAIRGRWEMETATGYSHFQVRNARISVDGMVAPNLSYMINTDFCDRGKMTILDAYAMLRVLKRLDIKVGQYRMPFGWESFRGPGGYFFNNRSFIGKQVNNYRAVGISAGYSLEKAPVTAEAGIFNPTTIDDHSRWTKTYAYAGRVIYKPSAFIFATGFESILPGDVRINLFALTASWEYERFFVEGEYMLRWYTHKTHATTHAYNVFANYALPLHKSVFNTLSFQARFDGMSNLASGVTPLLPNGKLETTSPAARRITLGATLDYKYKRIRAAVRLNFEKYWFDNKAKEPVIGEGDVINAEFIIKF